MSPQNKADNHGEAEGEDGYYNGTTGLPVGIHIITKRVIAIVRMLFCFVFVLEADDLVFQNDISVHMYDK
jgi:acyl-coenzyme A synthetase/AMP-(fatty) acid ligase